MRTSLEEGTERLDDMVVIEVVEYEVRRLRDGPLAFGSARFEEDESVEDGKEEEGRVNRKHNGVRATCHAAEEVSSWKLLFSYIYNVLSIIWLPNAIPVGIVAK